MGREEFLKRAWAWKAQYGGRIIEQLKKMGSSCDWERERFTMDEGCSKAVKEVFVRLYNKGLIYQGERIINWCPHCKTSISDAEVEYEEQDGYFWHLRYPVVGEPGRYVELATTRPETMIGDTAVAVHPDDDRYKDLVGKKVLLPLFDREIPVVADSYVDMEFGTGVVQITPAHDPNDFEVGQRHQLPVIKVLNDDGTVNELGGKYAGMDRYVARKAIVADLDAGGYLVKIEPHKHNVGTCYRCGTTVEPIVSKQWFVKMEPLAKPAIDVVKNGDLQFVPARFDKIYYHWMENIRDWCISRQLWWGHRIPAFYCQDCGETIVTADTPTTCPKCGGKLKQDEDTLDTWFSSALWPFSTLGWPENTEELKYFFPTSTLVTGYDIIFFWVARMIFSSVEQMGTVPFRNVLIHGIVRDEQGRKMSKSLGNGIDPLLVIDEYGADALRLMLATGNSPGNDMRYSEEKVRACRNFCNKLWNAARFILMNFHGEFDEAQLPEKLELEDKWFISKYNTLVKEVTENLDHFELGIAADKVQAFVWDIICDWYIEIVKVRLQSDGETKINALKILVYVLSNTLKLLHPFAPFITEEIWQALPHSGDTIMLSCWPKYSEDLAFVDQEHDFEMIMTAIKAIRNRRAEMGVVPSKKAELFIETPYTEVFAAGSDYFKRLAYASNVSVSNKVELENAVVTITEDCRAFIPMAELIDMDKERQRLEKELQDTKRFIASLQGKLANEQFVSRAPQAVVDKERDKLAKAEEKLEKIQESIQALA